MIPIHAVTVHAHPRESVAWFLCYRYVGDRATCESIAEAAGHHRRTAGDADRRRATSDILADAAVYTVEHDVAPHLTDLFAQSRANDVMVLVSAWTASGASAPRSTRSSATSSARCSARARPLRPRASPRSTRPSATARSTTPRSITYLTRRAYRDEWLYAPAVALYPERLWAKLDD